MEALTADQPEHLLAQQQLQALEEELAGGVAREVLAVGAAGVLLLAHDAARLAEVVVLVDVELHVALCVCVCARARRLVGVWVGFLFWVCGLGQGEGGRC